MRIIAGTAKGRRILSPRRGGTGRRGIRPTPDRVREAVFSILGGDVAGMRLLDVFAGTGAISAEALSRGGSFAVLLEQGHEALGLIRRNLESAGFDPDSWRLIPGDALSSLRALRRAGERFDVIYLDPPYDSDLGAGALREGKHLLRKGGVAILEHVSRRPPPEVPGLRIFRRRKFGDTSIALYRPEGAFD